MQPPVHRARAPASSQIQERIEPPPTARSRPTLPAQADTGRHTSLPSFLSLSPSSPLLPSLSPSHLLSLLGFVREEGIGEARVGAGDGRWLLMTRRRRA